MPKRGSPDFIFPKVEFQVCPFSTSRCPSMMVSIVETALSTKPTDKHQHLLHSSCHSLRSFRKYPYPPPPPLHGGQRKFLGEGVQKEAISEVVGGLLFQGV